MWPGWERAGWWAQVVRADFGLHVESFAVYGEGASQFCRAQDWVDRDHFLNELSLLSAWEGQRERAAAEADQVGQLGKKDEGWISVAAYTLCQVDRSSVCDMVMV